MWSYLVIGFIAGVGAGTAVFMWLIAKLVADIAIIASHVTHIAEMTEITRAE